MAAPGQLQCRHCATPKAPRINCFCLRHDDFRAQPNVKAAMEARAAVKARALQPSGTVRVRCRCGARFRTGKSQEAMCGTCRAAQARVRKRLHRDSSDAASPEEYR